MGLHFFSLRHSQPIRFFCFFCLDISFSVCPCLFIFPLFSLYVLLRFDHGYLFVICVCSVCLYNVISVCSHRTFFFSLSLSFWVQWLLFTGAYRMSSAQTRMWLSGSRWCLGTSTLGEASPDSNKNGGMNHCQRHSCCPATICGNAPSVVLWRGAGGLVAPSVTDVCSHLCCRKGSWSNWHHLWQKFVVICVVVGRVGGLIYTICCRRL